MMKDPNFGLEEGEEHPEFKMNAEIKPDMLVVALQNIKKGDEIFVNYKLAHIDNSDVESKGTESGEQDEDSSASV